MTSKNTAKERQRSPIKSSAAEGRENSYSKSEKSSYRDEAKSGSSEKSPPKKRKPSSKGDAAQMQNEKNNQKNEKSQPEKNNRQGGRSTGSVQKKEAPLKKNGPQKNSIKNPLSDRGGIFGEGGINSILSRFLGEDRGSVLGLPTQDLLLIGLIFMLSTEGSDDDLVLILLALLFVSSGEK